MSAHRSRNERSRPLHHPRREPQHGKKKVTTKNLAATLGMMGLAVGATLLVEGGPWKSRMAAAATVVGMEQVLERAGFFDEKEGKGVERVGREDEEGELEGRRERRDRGARGGRDARDVRNLDGGRRRRDVNESGDDDEDDKRRYRDRRERERERENRRDTRGAPRDSHDRTRRDTHDEERRHRERSARRKEANRRFDEKYEIEEIPA
ncbi:hypothetical protein MFRU_006g02270 [Monilinia fructicola]|uniref:Uncharacterized protein n=1 Tax=Monilinia fructicola TaxID=38448 RepID=A0A5M9JCM4_MONFR|nr:hypothetical protein EYC84_009493 [Monilinia fructicola]KAG4032763.1 hypothetical protein MFRU_006g02270 [Monilinia fructicola]